MSNPEHPQPNPQVRDILIDFRMRLDRLGYDYEKLTITDPYADYPCSWDVHQEDHHTQKLYDVSFSYQDQF
ncbi:MAG: hypothetical protein OXG44_12670 [Gammaproteobacteria bacterium]|nr:hypothetical protein [Gammaproteobacteria bacterium]